MKILIYFLLAFGILSLSQNDYKVDGDKFIYHTVSPSSKLSLYWKDDSGNVLGSIKNLKEYVESKKDTLVFAMNGGMYLKNQEPQGLFIENGKTIKNINNTEEAFGNFYMQPNGIFYLDSNRKGNVIQRSEFKMDNSISFATQSGPMLVINGYYHPKFMKGSNNLHIRNGVGVLENGELIFAMSKEKVNFYDMATFFIQNGCKNALYLDGFVSRTYLPEKGSLQTDGRFGVLIGQVK